VLSRSGRRADDDDGCEYDDGSNLAVAKEVGGGRRRRRDGRSAITTLVVAAPDIFTDPALAVIVGDGRIRSSMSPRLSLPLAEFESDRFRIFSSDLLERLSEFTSPVGGGGEGGGGGRVGLGGLGGAGIPTTTRLSSSTRTDDDDDEDVRFATHHPLWRTLGGDQSFPYPCFAVSSRIEA
jgi:hypothetical protein